MTSLPSERWQRVVEALRAGDGVEQTLAGMSSAAAGLLGVAGAAILVMADGVPGATFVSHPLAETLEDLQFALGSGPRVDAWRTGVPIAEIDLAAGPVARWPGFCAAAVDAGARSVYSFPLRLGAARVGALTVYRHETGTLDADVYADALVVADVVTSALLGAGVPLADRALRDEELNASVHQASGMVSVQLDIGVGEALARLRARAFADGTTLAELARRVVARSLRLDEP